MPPGGFRGGVYRNHGSADEYKEKLTGREWLRIFRFMRHKFIYFIALLFNLVQSASPYVLSVVQGQLATALIDYNFDTAPEFLKEVNSISNSMMVAILIIFGAELINAFSESYVIPAYLRDLRVAIMQALMEQDITYYDETQTGIILARITDDVQNAHEAYTERLKVFLRSIMSFISGLVICLNYSKGVTLIVASCMPLYVLSQIIGNKKVDKLWQEYNDCSTDVSAKAEEILTSFRTVRSFDAEIREYKNYKDRLKKVHDVVSRTSTVQGIQNFCTNIVHWGMSSFMLYYAGMQAARGEIEPGVIVTLMSIEGNWSFSISEMFSSIQEFKKSNVAAAKLLQITDRKPLVNLHEGRTMDNVIGKIEFKDVTFTYPSRDTPALSNMSFTVYPNETVAIVGESGCGKSTTLQLMQRFYNIDSGQILLDGVDIKELSPTFLRSQIAIVPQTPVMFSMPVKDNIRFGKPDAKRSEVVSSAMIANAHSFITQLKDGYRTKVGQNSLSGGQKQRICIARAVMMGAPILLLDEATAALDTESEKLVQEALMSYRQGKTAIIVAHRLATVRNADRILVLDKGHVIESGTHEELLEKNGAYANLVAHQLQ